ncbi:MAG: Rpn family recombination-promoting nuclease/putative transposase [Deltaproteobacteria bacterium]|nr:Rpn family recombination-promoting nuclease/putative transposase [Deltaproteobacteria bacterium]
MDNLINTVPNYDEIPVVLPPSNDGVFKALMTHPDASVVLPDLLSEFLGIKVTSVELRNTELPISDELEKQERFDVNCDFEDEEGKGQADVEMQATQMKGDSFQNNFKIIKERGTLYLCHLHSSQMGQGIRYDNLRRSYVVFFCGFKMYDDDKPIHSFKFRDDDGLKLTDAVTEIYVELPKFDTALIKPVSEMTGKEMWGIFFSSADNLERSEVVNEIVSKRKEIKVADAVLRNISSDPDMRAKFRSRMKFQTDLNTLIGVTNDQAREQGLKQGLEQGLKQGLEQGLKQGLEQGLKQGLEKALKQGLEKVRNDIAQNAIAKGLPLTNIAEMTGLTLDEVKRIRDKK